MFVLCVRLLEENGGVPVNVNERCIKRHNCVDITVYFKVRAVRGMALPALSSCVHSSGLREYAAEEEHH